jgi:hypothetical protein
MFDNIDLSKMSEAEVEALFARMSPEEMNMFLESLARRQGATEGLTSEASMNIAEIDPSTAKIDGPGYVPYSEGNRAPRVEEPAPVAAPPPASAAPAPAPPPPVVDLPEAMPEDDNMATRVGAAAQEGSLAWLENLASGGFDLPEPQQDDLFNLNLDDIESAAAPNTAPRQAVNTEAWLQDLARSQGELSFGDPPTADGDTLEWLESMAINQGASRDEFITSASLDIAPPDREVEPLVYTPFSFETPRTPAAESPVSSPEDFLKSLSLEQGYSETGVTATQKSAESGDDPFDPDTIQQALNSGNVTPEQVAVFFERSMDRGLSEPEPAPRGHEDDVPDAPLEAAELPSWLLEGISTGDAEPKAPPQVTGSIPLEELFSAVPSAPPEPDLMSWLGDDRFAGTLNELPDDPTEVLNAVTISDLELDTSDPWVEALDSEHAAGSGDLDNPPAWYLERTSDPERLARVEELAAGESTASAVDTSLSDEPLPSEEDLPFGTPITMPAWLNVEQPLPIVDAAALFTGANEPAAPAEDAEMPSWITQAIEEPAAPAAEEAPWWEQAVTPEQEPAAAAPAPQPEPVPVPQPVPAVPRPAAPRPQPAARVLPGDASLEGARARQKSGDLEGSLREYEAIVHAQQNLDEAVTDLANLAKTNRANPVVHRVLGDAYMRQGQLQKALDTYREALNNL